MVTTTNAVANTALTSDRRTDGNTTCLIAERFLRRLREAVRNALKSGVEDDFSISGEIELPGSRFGGILTFEADRQACRLFAPGQNDGDAVVSVRTEL